MPGGADDAMPGIAAAVGIKRLGAKLVKSLPELRLGYDRISFGAGNADPASAPYTVWCRVAIMARWAAAVDL